VHGVCSQGGTAELMCRMRTNHACEGDRLLPILHELYAHVYNVCLRACVYIFVCVHVCMYVREILPVVL